MAGEYVPNRGGLRALLKDDGLAKDLFERAEAIAFVAGGEARGFIPRLNHPGRRRSRAAVIAASDRARRDELEDQALSRAVDAGRD